MGGALPDSAPRSSGFNLFYAEGRDEQIQVCANKVQSRLEPAEQVGQTRTNEEARAVQKLLTTKSKPDRGQFCCKARPGWW